MDSHFLALVDHRAQSLGLNRSAYILQVLRQDLMQQKPGLMIVAEKLAAHPDHPLRYKVARPRKGTKVHS